MNKDFLKFFDLSFKKFLTKTSILVTLVSFNTSFATDAPSPTPKDGSTVSSPSKNRRASFGRSGGIFPAKKLEGEIVSPTAANHRRSSGASTPPVSIDKPSNPSSSLPQGGTSEEADAHTSKRPSILSFPGLTKKEEVIPPSTPADSSASISSATAQSPNQVSTGSGGAHTLRVGSPGLETRVPPSTSSSSGAAQSPNRLFTGSGGVPTSRVVTSEMVSNHISEMQRVVREVEEEKMYKAEEAKKREAEESEKRKVDNAKAESEFRPIVQDDTNSGQPLTDSAKAEVKPIVQDDTNSGQPVTDKSKVESEFKPIVQDNASKGLGILGHHASPRREKHDTGHKHSAPAPTEPASTSNPVNVIIANPPVDLPESTTDVETASFYPTPKSRHTGSTTLVRRISSVIGDHLFTRSLSQAAAAGDVGSEPVKFGFWGSANSDNTTNSDPGAKKKTTTFSQTLGFDADLGDVLVGGAISASKGRLGYKDGDNEGDKIKTNTKVFTLYNTIDLRWGLFSKAFVSYGSTRLHSYVDGASSEAKYKQKMWSGQTELGYNYKAGTLNYVVSGGVRYIHTDTPEHKEYSDGNLSQTVKKDTADDFEFIGSIGVNKLIQRDGYDIIPHVTFSARKRFAGQSPGTVYVREDSLAEYSVSGQSDKKFYSQVALGSQVKYKSAILQIGAHYGFAKKYSNIGGTMMLRFEM